MTSSPTTHTLVSRRSFLGGAVTLVCSVPLLKAGCGGGPDAAPQPTVIDGWSVPPGTTLGAETFALLAASMDAFLPGDEAHAGATRCHAAWYLDQFLGAFAVQPPRIYAGGPYSGRHGGVDGFSSFQLLTRVEEIRWRTYLEGSLGIPEREFNGPVRGLRQVIEEGLAALDAAARASQSQSFASLALPERQSLLGKAEESFAQTLYELTVEGTCSDPVYGGNDQGLGWAAINFEGDRLPLGYSAGQMLHPENG